MKGPALPKLTASTLGEALGLAAGSGEHGLTFIDAREEETALSWSELEARAQRIAQGLRTLGIRPGDRVAIVLPTSPAFCEAFFGAVLAGAVPVPLYPPVRLGRIEEYHRSTARMLELSGARVVLSAGTLRLLVGGALSLLARPVDAISVEALLISGATPRAEIPSATATSVASPDDVCLIQFSSGSTVDPKPVALSHHNVLAQCAALKALMLERPGVPPAGVSWLPLYHDMGLIGALLTAVYWPGPLALLPPEVFLARPALWLRAISRHRATVSPAPNFAYGLCLKRVKDADLEGVNLSSWQFALDGAEPVSPELLRRFADRFAAFGLRSDALRPVYGLSEATLAVTWAPHRAAPLAAQVDAALLATEGRICAPGAGARTREIASVGVPVPGAEVEVRSALETPLGEREVGRVFVRGPSVMVGYFNQPDATARVLDASGWLDTGDLGFWLGGELHLCGRARDVVIIRGANHAPQEFEECAATVPGVRAGSVVAVGFVPEGEDGEALLVLAERAEGATADLPAQIAAEVLGRTGVRPHTVQVLAPGTLPKTSSGKLRRAEALRRYLAGALRAPAKTGTLQLLSEVVRSEAARARARSRGNRER
jgi:fatty-acyl-CoA synthase